MIERCNNTQHSSLDEITRNQAISDPKKRMHVMHLNILKAQDKGFIADLKPGDKVRMPRQCSRKALKAGGVMKSTW